MQELTLKDSGITVKIRKVSPLLFLELRKQNPAPKPPRNKVTDLNGKEAWEENSANPEYLEAVAEYNEHLESLMSALMFKRGVEVPVDKEAVEELKQFWRDNFGKELEGEDRDIYLRYIAIQSTDDFDAVYSAIMEKSQPTAEDLNSAQQTFRG